MEFDKLIINKGDSMLSAETKRLVMVEYPIDVVYETLFYLFPLKTLRLYSEDKPTHNIVITDATNYTFIMHVTLTENTSNTTIVSFLADYPHAVADLTGGGEKAINTVLGELLSELEKLPKAENVENEYAPRDDVEVMNSQIFENSVKKHSDTGMIVAGYGLCILMFALPAIILSLRDPNSSFGAMLFVGAVLCLCFAMTISILLSFTCDARKSIMHGKIQACVCGLFFALLALLIDMPIFLIMAVILPAIIIGYSIKRDHDTY